MAGRGFLERRGIVSNAIGKDLLQFALPAVVVFAAGVVVSALDGWNGLVPTILDNPQDPDELPSFSVLNGFGLALVAVGFVVLSVATVTLRRSYSSTLVSCGIPVAIISAYGTVIMLAMIPLFLNRIRMEETLLIGEFGDTYLTYRKTTKRLIPFIF